MSVNLQGWVMAFRPKTLTAAFVPIICAAALATYLDEAWSWSYFFYLLIAAFSIQIATNLFNDAIDFEKGADKERLGPQRVTQSGLFDVKTVYTVARVFCVIALLFGVPLVLRGGLPILGIGLVSLLLAYGYTGGPYPLAYKGVGDIFVVLFFGVIAVTGSFYILTRIWSYDAFVLGLQVGFLATMLIAMNNLRDSETDAKVGKLTLAVRYGDEFVKIEILSLMALSYALLFYWIQRYHDILFLIFLFSLPIAYKIYQILQEKEKKPEQLINGLEFSALLHLIFGLTFCLACWIGKP